MKTKRGALGLVGWMAVVFLGGGLPGAKVSAQSGAETEPAAKVGCLRGRPLPSCKSFWIVEMQGHTPLVQSRRSVSYGDGVAVARSSFEDALEWNLGHMVNLAPGWALGGVVTAGTGGYGPLTGIKARARHWISEDLALELQGGWLRSGARYPMAQGVTGDVRVNIRDQGSFFLRWDGVTIDPEARPEIGYFDEGGFEHAFSVGVGAGSVPALVGSGALGLGYLILFAIYLHEAR